MFVVVSIPVHASVMGGVDGGCTHEITQDVVEETEVTLRDCNIHTSCIIATYRTTYYNICLECGAYLYKHYTTHTMHYLEGKLSLAKNITPHCCVIDQLVV